MSSYPQTSMTWQFIQKRLKTTLKRLELVSQHLRDVHTILKPSRCCFSRQEVEVLGFVVSREGIKPHPSNIQRIKDFLVPKNKTGIRAFVSLAGFYHRHVQAFGDLVDPLNKMLKKNADFYWNLESGKSFNITKQLIAQAAVLKYPDPQKPYKLYIDASNIGICAVLVQFDDKIQEDRPVCFLSHEMTPAEINYLTVEKEFL